MFTLFIFYKFGRVGSLNARSSVWRTLWEVATNSPSLPVKNSSLKFVGSAGRRRRRAWFGLGLYLFRYVTNCWPKANSAFHQSGVGKWVPASGGNIKAGMAHSVSDVRGVCMQVKLWDPLRTRAIPERVGVFTTRRYTNPRLPYLYLTFAFHYGSREPVTKAEKNWRDERPQVVMHCYNCHLFWLF